MISGSARLRHIVLATDALAADARRAREGFGLAPGISDAEGMLPFHAEHEVLVLGSAYLEIMAPLGPAAPSARFLARGGPGGYMLDLQVPDLDGVIARAARLGLAPVLRDVYRGNPISQWHPRDFGTLLEADQITGGRDWHWDAEFPAEVRAAERAVPTAAVLAVPDPAATARRWAEVFGGSLAGTAVGLDGVTVSFTALDEGRPGLRSVDVTVPPGGAAGPLEVAGVVFWRSTGAR